MFTKSLYSNHRQKVKLKLRLYDGGPLLNKGKLKEISILDILTVM